MNTRIRTAVIAVAVTAAAGFGLAACATSVPGTAIRQEGATVQSQNATTPTTSQPEDRSVPAPSEPATRSLVDFAVDDMHADLQKLVSLYTATGSSLSSGEMVQLTGALNDVTTSTNAVSALVKTGSYSIDQMAALSDMADAGSIVFIHVGMSGNSGLVQAAWSDFDRAYQAYLSSTS